MFADETLNYLNSCKQLCTAIDDFYSLLTGCDGDMTREESKFLDSLLLRRKTIRNRVDAAQALLKTKKVVEKEISRIAETFLSAPLKDMHKQIAKEELSHLKDTLLSTSNLG